jgi:nitronate monooxygenase
MIVTALTEMFGLQHPIVLGPMGSVSGGHLAATVSNAGGLGLVGGGYGHSAWLRTELTRVKEETSRPWGVGLITWSIDRSVFELALGYRPDAFMLSFGDPRPYAQAIKSAGCKLICQVQGLDEARLAQEAAPTSLWPRAPGPVARGPRATLPLVPAVVDTVAPTPVGGQRHCRRARSCGGTHVGRPRCADRHTLMRARGSGQDRAKQRIVARGMRLAHARVDIVRGYAWRGRTPGAPSQSLHGALARPRRDLAGALESSVPRIKWLPARARFRYALVWAGGSST